MNVHVLIQPLEQNHTQLALVQSFIQMAHLSLKGQLVSRKKAFEYLLAELDVIESEL